MEEKKKAGQAEKLSYEQLKQMVSDFYQENQKLRAQIQNFDATSFLLSMLFKVMDHAERYDAEFVKWTKDNIQDTLTGFMGEVSEEEKKNEDK